MVPSRSWSHQWFLLDEKPQNLSASAGNSSQWEAEEFNFILYLVASHAKEDEKKAAISDSLQEGHGAGIERIPLYNVIHRNESFRSVMFNNENVYGGSLSRLLCFDKFLKTFWQHILFPPLRDNELDRKLSCTRVNTSQNAFVQWRLWSITLDSEEMANWFCSIFGNHPSQDFIHRGLNLKVVTPEVISSLGNENIIQFISIKWYTVLLNKLKEAWNCPENRPILFHSNQFKAPMHFKCIVNFQY